MTLIFKFGTIIGVTLQIIKYLTNQQQSSVNLTWSAFLDKLGIALSADDLIIEIINSCTNFHMKISIHPTLRGN